jgi:hypothetical protein
VVTFDLLRLPPESSVLTLRLLLRCVASQSIRDSTRGDACPSPSPSSSSPPPPPPPSSSSYVWIWKVRVIFLGQQNSFKLTFQSRLQEALNYLAVTVYASFDPLEATETIVGVRDFLPTRFSRLEFGHLMGRERLKATARRTL